MRVQVCIGRWSCWPLGLYHGFVWFVMPQTAATGFTFIHQGGMHVSTGGVIGIDAGGLTSNSGLTITAGGSLLYSDEQVRVQTLPLMCLFIHKAHVAVESTEKASIAGSAHLSIVWLYLGFTL